MAKKKRKSDEKRPRPARRPKRKSEETPAIPDRRILERFLHELVSGNARDIEPSPLDEAQEVMYLAFEAQDPKERVALARQALAIATDCADAYVLLAELARTRKEALEFYRNGVAAGERALGPAGIANAAGHFWGILETRPLMRARHGLAECLWTLGKRDDAIAEAQELLRLNPNDNQGVRYILASWLLKVDRDTELDDLLARYAEDGSATWAYTRALRAFRRDGDSPEARQALERARASNAYVPAYLRGDESLPAKQPASYGWGNEDEAILYVGNALGVWKGTPGAIAWLDVMQPKPKTTARKAKAPKPKGPTAAARKRLERLPRTFDVWQADRREMPSWIESGGERVRPWAVLVASVTHGIVLAHTIHETLPSAEAVWDTLALAMERPISGPPHRPSELQLRSEQLSPPLDAIGVNCVVTDDLDLLDLVFQDMAKHLSGDILPGLLEMPGVGPRQVAEFYESAAEFYRRAPWRALGCEAAIEVACSSFESGPWYAVIMGQSGLTFGVALYDDLTLLRRLWDGELSDEENARETVALSMTFGDEASIPIADLDAGKQHGWEVAGPDAYPAIFRKERGMTMRPPLAWELELMEGTLRALPDFVARHPLDDPAHQQVTVRAASGDLTLVLSWVDG